MVHSSLIYKANLINDEERIIADTEFIEKNKLVINKDVAVEILEKCHPDNSDADSYDFGGFRSGVALSFVEYDLAEPFLEENFRKLYKRGKEAKEIIINNEKAVQVFLDNLVFAYKVAQEERGLSANRCVFKLGTYLRILSRPDLADIMENKDNYDPYGKPALSLVTKALELDVPEWIKSWESIE